MPRLFRKSGKPVGTAPGALIHIGDKGAEHVQISMVDYNQDQYTEHPAATLDKFLDVRDENSVTWLNICGIHDVELMEKIGRELAIHPLIMADILNDRQRPKLEEVEDYIYLVFKMLTYDSQTRRIHSEQISLIVGSNFVISFQEIEGDVFDPIRERIRRGKGRIRKSGCGYLAYALVDAVVDHYFIILETLGEEIEDLEEDLIENPDESLMETIHMLKGEMILFRKQVWPAREMVSRLVKSESELIHESTEIYYSDVYDHVIQVIDTIESFRDILTSMLDLYLSTVSNRMNEVMKMLTIMATIFIPLTFIAGIYGMNFEWMPELKMKYGYFYALGGMAAIAGAMVKYFKNKKWL